MVWARNHLHFLVVGVMELFPGRSLMALPAENQREVYVLNGTRRSVVRPRRRTPQDASVLAVDSRGSTLT